MQKAVFGFLAFVHVGCFSPSSPSVALDAAGPSLSPFDATTGPVFDGSPSPDGPSDGALEAATPDVSQPDAGGGDGAAEAAPVPKETTVVVSDELAGLVPGAKVFFHLGDGGIDTASTDDAGVARYSHDTPLTVTTHYMRGTDAILTTLVGVEPGDALFVGRESSSDTGAVSISGAVTDTQSPTYYAEWGCTSSPVFASTYAGTTYDRCRGPSGEIFVLLIGYTSGIKDRIGTVIASPTDAGGFVADFLPADVSPITTRTYGVTGTPPVGTASFDYEVLFDKFGVPYGQESHGWSNGDPVPSFSFVPGTDFLVHRGSAYLSSTGTHARRVRWAERMLPPSGGIQVDLATLLPSIDTASVSGTQTAPALSWTSSSPLSGANGILATLVSSLSRWTFVLPPGSSAVAAPVLPSSIASTLPVSPWQLLSLQAFASPAIGGYKPFRQRAAGVAGWVTAMGSPEYRALPRVPYSVRVTEYHLFD